MRKLNCPPGTEISGDGILSLVENIAAEEIQPVLDRHNLSDIKRDEWYPAQDYLDVLTDISKSFYMNLVAVGMAVGQNTHMPPELEQMGLGNILEIWDAHYQMHHRNGDIGYAETEKIADDHYAITIHRGLYPDDLEYGVAYGFARRFLPEGQRFVVEYGKHNKRLDEGGKSTTIHVRWGNSLPSSK